jgi:hypothetical protein
VNVNILLVCKECMHNDMDLFPVSAVIWVGSVFDLLVSGLADCATNLNMHRKSSREDSLVWPNDLW